MELPTWSFSAAALAKQLPQKITFKVGRRKRNGEGIHMVSHCNARVLVLMGHRYKCAFSDLFKRPRVELEAMDLNHELRHLWHSGSDLAL